jgi:hypothetical protein
MTSICEMQTASKVGGQSRGIMPQAGTVAATLRVDDDFIAPYLLILLVAVVASWLVIR